MPLSVILVPFIVGILWANDSYGLSDFEKITLSLSFLLAFGIFSYPFFLIRNKENVFPDHSCIKRCLLLALVFLIFSIGGYQHFLLNKHLLRQSQRGLLHLADLDEKVVLTGFVNGLGLPRQDGVRVEVFVEGAKFEGKILKINESVIAKFKGLSWESFIPGKRLRFAARLFPIRNFGTPGTFDFKNWWALRGHMVRASCQSPLEVIFLKGDVSHPSISTRFFLWVDRIRNRVAKNIISTLGTGKVSAVAIALVTGSRAWFDKDLKNLVAASGIGHLFAVSGLHMAIVAAAAVFLVRSLLSLSTRLLLLTDVNRLSWLAATVACGFYCCLAGFSPSSLRALVMVLSLAFCIFMYRKTTIEAGLFVAAWLLLIKSPFYLFDISFQLSFLVVFFLIYLGRQMDDLFPLLQKAPLRFLGVCLLAFIICSPLVSFYFQRFNPWSLLLNILCIPLVEFLVLPLLLLGLIFSLLSTLIGSYLVISASYGIKLLLALVSIFAGGKWLNHFVVPPTILELSVIFTFFLALPFLAYSKRPVFYLIFCLTALFLGHTVMKKIRVFKARPVLHVLDVGQGLCQVLRLPTNITMVIDTGGIKGSDFDIGSGVVAPYLRRLGIRRIDILALSHWDTDHSGGAACLVKQFDIGQIWLPSLKDVDAEKYRPLMSEAKRKHIRTIFWYKSGNVSLGANNNIQVLVPGRGSRFVGNNAGIVLRISSGKWAFLLTGDIERGREEKLLTKGPIISNVLVVPHHGSKTSSSMAFLRKISPRVAVCSCGYRNPFHHPSTVVVKRFDALGIPFLRTDRDGTVDIKIAGDQTIEIAGYYLKDSLVLSRGNI